MCADRDSSSSPGLRALLGRFLHGLLQYRVFQLLGAAWSYLIGLSGVSLFSFLPSAWVLHRSVRPDEFPEMLEALGLRSGPWEELEECLEELGPWKELLSPAMKADLEILKPWPGYVPSSKEQEMGSWHSKMRALWEPGTWRDLVDPEDEEDDECCRKSSGINADSGNQHKMTTESHLYDLDLEKNGALAQPPPRGMVSCIYKAGSGGVFTWLDLGKEHSLQNKDVLNETSSHKESKVEIEHIRNKRLWFLQQNQGQDVPDPIPKQPVHNVSALSDPTLLTDMPVFGWHDGYAKDISPDNQLLSDYDLDQSRVMAFPGPDPDSKPCHPLSLLVQKPEASSNTQSKYPPSPDQDQGYHSLENWQCVNITQNLQSGGLSPLDISGSVWNNGGAHVPAGLSCSVMKDLEYDYDTESDLDEEIHTPNLPVCTNKHIGYILGTVVSDEEEDPSSSCEDEDDDGFDSEGSVSATEGDIPVPDEVVLWTSFCRADPYNPQNFTATLQTGPVEVNSHPEDQDTVISDDEESWCDSDAVSDSDSEDEFSTNEEENLKLWNGFLKSEDPYNLLFFKASVQTSELKRQNGDVVTKHPEPLCAGPPTCERTVPTHPNDSRSLRVRERHSVSREQSANVGHKKSQNMRSKTNLYPKMVSMKEYGPAKLKVAHSLVDAKIKKVIFNEIVTIYYVCNEEERKGHWEEFARDRCRFQRRIHETESMIGHCFTPDHRQRVWNRMQDIWGS